MRPAVVTGLLVLLASPLADAEPAPKRTRLDASRIGVASNSQVRSLVAGEACQLACGPRALRQAGRATVQLARSLAGLIPEGGGSCSRVLITPTLVVLERSNGLVDLMPRADVTAQLKSGSPLPVERQKIGVKSMGRYVYADAGPNGTLMLYRQLPRAARGEVASSGGYTSFALSLEDAFHPFGQAGRTVRVAVPKAALDDAIAGRAGGVGWCGQDGYSLGIDVEEEVQIPSAKVRQLTP